MNSSSIHHRISTVCGYTHTHTHIYINTYTRFTDSVFDNRQLNMKQDNIIIRQHTHARDERQLSQQNTLHKNRKYETSIYNNLKCKNLPTLTTTFSSDLSEASTRISVPILRGSKEVVKA